MSEITRRLFIGAGAAAGGRGGGRRGRAARPGGTAVRTRRGAAGGDPRYEYLAVRRTNLRFRHEPEYFHLASSTEQVVKAVQEAVRG
ncbi:hypothetical protein ACFSTC_16810 [Nonomuraea ferruginea]